jgi:hypothetical protein
MNVSSSHKLGLLPTKLFLIMLGIGLQVSLSLLTQRIAYGKFPPSNEPIDLRETVIWLLLFLPPSCLLSLTMLVSLSFMPNVQEEQSQPGTRSATLKTQ